MPVNVDDVVDVEATIVASPAATTRFGDVMFLTPDAESRLAHFESVAEVASVYGTPSSAAHARVSAAAAAFFGQQPRPSNGLFIGQFDPSSGGNNESAAVALAAIKAAGARHGYLICPAPGTTSPGSGYTPAQAVSIAEAIGGRDPYQVIIEDTAAGALTANEAASASALYFARQNARNSSIISKTLQYKNLALAAHFAAIDLDRGDQLQNPYLQTLENMEADTFTDEQIAEIERKRSNFYSPLRGVNSFFSGVTTNPSIWMDQQFWLDWFVYAVQNSLVDAVRAGVPQNSDGQALIAAYVGDVCQKGVDNGGIASGEVRRSVRDEIRIRLGSPGFDGNLPRGYLIHVASFDTLSDADRSARKLPTIRVWMKERGFANDLTIRAQFVN